MRRLTLTICCSILIAGCGCAPPSKKQVFVESMAAKHGFRPSDLQGWFDQIEIRDDILKKISKPAEAMPWFRYRKIFLNDARVQAGITFLRQHAAALNQAQQQYGVPPEIIVAILGVETLYGQRTGNYRVIDALSTLAFAYPPRAPFFTKELEQFLLLCKEQGLDPLKPTGSYAGAMGMPQFMPSSYRNFSADFDNDGQRDIWHNPNDAIASVANYFKAHGWAPGEAIASPVLTRNEKYKTLINTNIKPYLRIHELELNGIQFSEPQLTDLKANLLLLEQENGEDLWAVFNNFYVITRYNHSPLYAMAVLQLSQAIKKFQSVEQ